MIVIGLTGSIAMGKTTVGALFREEGAPVFDSDAAVHAYYRSAEALEVEAAFPGVVVEGVVDRAALSRRVLDDPAALLRLEAIVHPRVARARRTFLDAAAAQRRRIAALDIPLLFESSSEKAVDLVVVVSAPESVQKARAFARAGMTAQRLAAIIARQTPDHEKRRRAHFVIDTDCPLEATRLQVRGLLRAASGMAGSS